MGDIAADLKTYLKTISVVTDIVGAGAAAKIYQHEPRHKIKAPPPYIVYEVFEGTSEEDLSGASGLADALEQLIRDVGLPSQLRDMGVSTEDLDGIPEAAMDDHSTPSNPRPLSVDDCRAVLNQAF